MKKFVLILLLILTVGFLPLAPAMAQSLAPHEAPEAAKRDALDAYALLVSYRDVLQFLSAENYEEASQAVERLKYVSLPPEIKFIADRFNNLLSELNTTLGSIDKSLEEASLFLSALQLDEAQEKLEEAERSLRYAKDLLQFIQGSVSALASHPLIAVIQAPAESRLQEAYQSLREMLQRLEDLRKQYDDLWQSLHTQAEKLQQVESEPTQLTLELSPSSAWVGESVVARGQLTSPQEGISLSGREVKVQLGEDSLSAVTGGDGFYEAELSVPYLYVSSIAVQAFYQAVGDRYQSSSSSPRTLTILSIPTQLSLGLFDSSGAVVSSAWVGESVVARGQLTSPQEVISLSGREVKVQLGEDSFSAVTGGDGFYEAELSVPYLYVSSIAVQAFYPGAGDRYQPSWSDSVPLKPLFHQTELEITAPRDSYPGWTTAVTGLVTLVTTEGKRSPVEARPVQIFLDNQLLATTITDSAGTFKADIVLAPQTSTGEYKLKVAVQSQGRYLGISQEKALTILRMRPDIQLPNLVFISLTREIHLGGKISSALSPSQRAPLTLEIKGIKAQSQTSLEGNFAVTLKVSPSTVPFGFQKVKVTVNSPEPWHLPIQKETTVFVLDLANIGLASLAFLSLGAIAYVRRRGRIYPRKPGPLLPLSEEEPAERELSFKPKVRPSEESVSPLLRFYWEAVREVKKVWRISFLPTLTLREFLEQARPKLGEVALPFSRLTGLAERALYSSYPPGVVEISEGEALVLQVKELSKGLSDGTA